MSNILWSMTVASNSTDKKLNEIHVLHTIGKNFKLASVKMTEGFEGIIDDSAVLAE